MNHKLINVLLAAAIILTLACNSINSMTQIVTGGGGAGTVAELWADVPPLDGATKADLQLPVAMTLIIRTVAQGRMNFIAYTTSKTADEVAKFYSAEQMKTGGWETAGQGCNTVSGDKGQSFTMCAFTKKADGKEEALAIIAAPDDKNSAITNVYYVRIDTTSTPEAK